MTKTPAHPESHHDHATRISLRVTGSAGESAAVESHPVHLDHDELTLDLPEGFCGVDDQLHIFVEAEVHDEAFAFELHARVAHLEPDQLDSRHSHVRLTLTSLEAETWRAFVVSIEGRQDRVGHVLKKIGRHG